MAPWSLAQLVSRVRRWAWWLRAARRRHPRVAAVVAAGVALTIVACAGAAFAVVRGLWLGLPDDAALARLGEMDQATTVYDAHGVLVFTIYKERRLDVPLERVSPDLVKAILAIEDQRFYDHRGFDLVRIGGAALANLRSRRVEQGGSTITQQLARQSFLVPDKTLTRKLQELVLAARIERRYSKPDILRLYLNKIYFGDGLYGAEAAARGFFGRSAAELTTAQAALLAGLVKSPSTYAPTVSLERAIERRDLVLQVMRDTGAIDPRTWEAARREPTVLADSLRADEPYGQYFKEQVRRELVARFGWSRVYQGGLRVYATLDRQMQLAAEAAVAERLNALERDASTSRRRPKSGPRQQPPTPAGPPLQAALVALDPATGEVRAMVGGRDFSASTFNRAVQARRQPGSAFKPFVYAAALEAGYTAATMVEPVNVPVDTLQGSWIPEDDHLEEGPLSVRQALRVSSNRAAVKVLQQVGIQKIVASVKALGIGEMPSVPSLALGSGEVTLQALTAAYAGFANRGLVPHPYLIRRVEDRDGQVLFAENPSTRRAMSEATAYLMTSMLADVVDTGTGARARRLGFSAPAAGKTGTTNDYRDAWFIGFTPRLVAGVWVGFDQPRPIARRGFASDIAVPLWASFMKAATQTDPPEWFEPPDTVTSITVCRLSGKLPTSECSRSDTGSGEGFRATDAALSQPSGSSPVYLEYFARGTEPTERCPVHPERGFFGRLASVFTGSSDEHRAPAAGAPSSTTGPRGRAESAAEKPSASEKPSEPETSKKKRGFWARLFGRH